jgi:hypothetical protein
MRPSLIIHHGNCPDGFGAAWWLGKNLDEPHEKFAAFYGQDPPDVTDREVWMVDFCYPAPVLTRIAAKCESLLVLDHHESAVGYARDAAGVQFFDDLSAYTDLAELGGGSMREAVIDQKHSGVGLVSALVKRRRGVDPPRFLANLEDRDLWRFDLDDTREVFATVTSGPYTDEWWDWLAEQTQGTLVMQGVAIERYRQQLIQQCVELAYQRTFVTPLCLDYSGVLPREVTPQERWEYIWVANAPYAICSDVAGELAKRDPERFAATFFIDEEGPKWSLRSTEVGMNVAEVAAKMQPGVGGGHAHAAGFRGAW